MPSSPSPGQLRPPLASPTPRRAPPRRPLQSPARNRPRAPRINDTVAVSARRPPCSDDDSGRRGPPPTSPTTPAASGPRRRRHSGDTLTTAPPPSGPRRQGTPGVLFLASWEPLQRPRATPSTRGDRQSWNAHGIKHLPGSRGWFATLAATWPWVLLVSRNGLISPGSFCEQPPAFLEIQPGPPSV